MERVFNLYDRYRLELRWASVKYEVDGVCLLSDAVFTGPALTEASRLNDADHIHLDFYRQYFFLTRSVYLGKFSWRGVTYNDDGSVGLGNARIEHASELNRVPKLEDRDFLIIDTNGHEDEAHLYNLVYKTYVVNEDSQLYRFAR